MIKSSILTEFKIPAKHLNNVQKINSNEKVNLNYYQNILNIY